MLLTWTGGLNKRISDERPFDINTPNRKDIIAEIYFDLVAIQPFYSILLKDHGSIITALKSRKKAILFQKLEFKESVIA